MIRFMRYKWLYFFISAIVILPGIFSILIWGFKPAIDFTGGSLLEVRTHPPNGEAGKLEVRKEVPRIEKFLKEKKIEFSAIQSSGVDSFIIRMKPIDKNKSQEIITDLSKKFGKIEEIRFETVGPILGKELIKKTIIGILLASGFILFYVGSQFKEKLYGICAIIAMFHDSLVLLGIFSLLGHFLGVEIDTLFVTALLTILSFSVHDTVVVYDRIRESQKHFPNAGFEDLANKAVNETLIRSLNNSLTIIFMLLSLWLLGGSTTKWFIFALLIGTVSGTYSSTFTAVPLLVIWNEKRKISS